MDAEYIESAKNMPAYSYETHIPPKAGYLVPQHHLMWELSHCLDLGSFLAFKTKRKMWIIYGECA